MLYHLFFTALISVFLLLYLFKRSRVTNIVASIIFVILFVGYPLSYLDILSRPKSVTEEYFKHTTKEVEVLGYVIQPNVALFLLLGIDGISEPRYYRMPWSESTKKKAQQLVEGFGKEGRRYKLKRPFAYSFLGNTEDDSILYPIPPVPPKPKERSYNQTKEFNVE